MIVSVVGEIPPADALGQVHFIGIGGAGMSGIARIMRGRGIAVSGSDAKDSAELAGLAALGAEVYSNHDPAHLGAANTVVVSTAIRESNPEYRAAVERGLLILPRAAALAAVMQGRRTVAVAGTHGKTTTTSMLAVMLRAAGADPGFAIGGTLLATGEGAYDGTGELFVAEADESDGSFLLYTPYAAIVTNVEPDHLDHYGTAEAVAKGFVDFADRVRPDGFLVTCVDDPGARALAESARARGVRVLGYGEAPDADVAITAVAPDRTGWSFTLAVPGHPPLTAWVADPKRHDVANAAAALTVGLELGLPAAALVSGLAGFTGTRRRFELRGRAGGVTVYDDYAHHPTEVASTLRAARRVAGSGRVVAVFQPHLYSRTRYFAAEFGAALGLADEVVVLDVYAAREDPLPGVSGAVVAEAVPLAAERVRFMPADCDVPAVLAATIRPGDVVLTLGAGDVTDLAPLLLARLEAG
ncbi:MAG: UDP-N-acetylmuramate--L-alanine ligase [Sporichthyaceae bacterium]|nr:UDP-N-acetylmuramate--L-alanine ligase [Sporichthyaceae bacterium]